MATKLYGGRWRVIGTLGQGGQSIVYEVEDTTRQLPGTHALKRIQNPKRHGRFANEVSAIKRLDSPRIVKLVDHSPLDSEEPDDKVYLVITLARGGDLSERVHSFQKALIPTIIVAKQLCEALQVAHASGVYHRDLKPQNVLFTGDTDDIVLTDFGICFIQDSDRFTLPDEVVGARRFLPPEAEAGGPIEVTAAGDIYSLGKLIYYMLSGGVVVPREQIDDDEYAALFSSGGAYTDLHGLLRRMICPLAARIQDVSAVLAELEKIETYDLRSKGSILDLGLLEGVKQNAIREFAASEQDARIRNEYEARLRNVAVEIDAWLEAVLQNAADSIRVDGVIDASVQAFVSGNNFRNINLPPAVSVTILKGQRLAVLNRGSLAPQQIQLVLTLCRQLTTTFRTAGAPRPAVPEPVLYIVPLTSYAPGALVPGLEVPMINAPVRVGQPATSPVPERHFTLSEWPAIRQDLENFIATCLGVVIRKM
jgi:serine/threonine protein kinase